MKKNIYPVPQNTPLRKSIKKGYKNREVADLKAKGFKLWYGVYKNQKGQIIVIGLVFFAILILLASAILGFILNYMKSERQNIAKVQALQLTEAGIDKAAYELNRDPGYTGETNTVLGSGSFTVTVTEVDSVHKRVTSVGSVAFSGGHTATGRVNATLAIDDTVISFRYGIQAGNGGFTLNNSATITGNAFSTGPVIGLSDNYIYGDIVSAGPGGWVYGVHATGNIFSHTIGESKEATIVDKDAYYASITNTTVSGTSHPGSPDQSPVPLPISDAQIEEWESDAEAGGAITACDGDGDYEVSTDMPLGSKKIACNLVIKNVTLTVTGPLWVTGNITIQTDATIQMDSGLGVQNVAVIADNPSDTTGSGRIIIEQQSNFFGSGSPGSFVFLISQNNSAETGGSTSAISQSQGAAALVAYAGHGLITMEQSANVKEATAYKISLSQSSNVTYDSGLPSTLFESGPGASWTFDPGSYVVQ